MELLIGLGIGTLGVAAVALAGFLLTNKQTNRTQAADQRADQATAKAAEEAAALAVAETSLAALKIETADLRTTTQSQAARIAVLEQQLDVYTRVVQANPGALPDALGAELDRLRAQVPAGPAPAAAGDPGGATAGAVHDGSGGSGHPG